MNIFIYYTPHQGWKNFLLVLFQLASYPWGAELDWARPRFALEQNANFPPRFPIVPLTPQTEHKNFWKCVLFKDVPVSEWGVYIGIPWHRSNLLQILFSSLNFFPWIWFSRIGFSADFVCAFINCADKRFRTVFILHFGSNSWRSFFHCH